MTGIVWIDYGRTFQEFIKDDLSNPGTVIECDGEIQLIGSINELGGVCDDCNMINLDDIIVRYAVVLHDLPPLKGSR